ncbi:UBP5 like deubiquitinating enzyme with a UB hydrolase domain and two UBA domains [Cryptosporidium sp. chipmunk genotype I]|uniref:UBP5 like deubiquitinating enzyme with a UB hydrolase domain and two UBA domains n=1 Tax=Cryptosporidium sp. chipmunk genotype I TaxID=1280935 RepID=UPI00351AA6C7|nr:UBP5 like deubiquitinating enzyme with a UB hydrolase domain and two UBA domains [Cryptosporidium sp. chipmunk genotype I]
MNELFDEYLKLVGSKIERKDTVYKAQCQLSFKDPFSEGGLYVNLKNFEAYSMEFLEWDHKQSGCKLYLSIKGSRKYHSENIENPTNLSIGKEGGYFPEKPFFEDLFQYGLISFPDMRLMELTDTQVNKKLFEKLNYIIQYDQNMELSKDMDSLVSWAEERKVSRHAENLFQVSSPKQIPPKGWTCEICGAGTNLWLNLSDGFIGCGRRLYGVGGGCFEGKEEGAALLHYRQYIERPLAVKLGTITQFGNADVFSYDPQEDDLVVDPHLVKHLSLFGINVGQLEKTEKSLTEMQIEQNNKLDLTSGTESEDCGSFLPVNKLCKGGDLLTALVGLENSGNSCYVNVVLQLLASIPEVGELFSNHFQDLLEIYSKYFIQKTRPRDSIVIQFSKVIKALLTNDVINDRNYKISSRSKDVQKAIFELKKKGINENIIDSLTENEVNPCLVYVLPSILKRAISKGNPEFSSSHQQDTLEYFTFLQERLTDDLKKYLNHSSQELQKLIKEFINLFSFFLGERLECKQSGSVKLTSQLNSVLSLPIPKNLITHCSDTRQSKKPKHALDEGEDSTTPKSNKAKEGQGKSDNDECFSDISLLLSNWKQEEIVENFLSPCTNQMGKAGKSNFMKSMPKYLIIHMQRFYLSEDWKPKKINLSVKVPNYLDLEFLRGSEELKPGEKPFPEGVDGANKVLKDEVQVPESLVNSVLDLGFTKSHAELAIKNTFSTDIDVCINWILTNIDSISSMDLALSDTSSSSSNATKTNNLASPQDLEAIENIISICCCSKDIAEKAFKISNQNLERAIQMIFDDPSIIESFEDTQLQQVVADPNLPSKLTEFEDGPGKYELIGVICHLGKSVHSGHYICYNKRKIDSIIDLTNQQTESPCSSSIWIRFNDTKVYLSKEDDFPHKEKGYIYLYRRIKLSG